MPGPILWGPNNTSNNLQNQILQGNGSLLAWDGPKNYISYNNFENGLTTGWSLGTVGTLTNGIPTGSPTFGSGASGNLSITTVTSGQIGGTTSLSYASSAATTQGNMLATQAYSIDTEDQAKVLTFKFYYSVPVGTGNFSGTSSNSFGIAIWDATNSAWLTSTANFGMTQITGVGYVTGTCQTAITTASIQLVIYNANATSGAITLYFDDFFLGPQTAPSGPTVTDWVAYTPTISATFGTTTGVSFFSRRVGDSLEILGSFTAGTIAASAPTITIGYNGANANVTFNSSKVNTSSLIGDAVCTGGASTTNFRLAILSPSANAGTAVQFGNGTSTAGAATVLSTDTPFASSSTIQVHFTIPITGWSSNLSMSNDTDTRVVAAIYNSTTANTIANNTTTYIDFANKTVDTHGAVSGAGSGNVTTSGTGWRYIVPVTGLYSVSTIVGFGAASKTNIATTFAGINVNGALIFQGPRYDGLSTGTNGFLQPSTAGVVSCNAGDRIEISIIQGTGATVTQSTSSGDVQVCINRLSGPSVIAATESVNGRYFSSSTTLTGSDTTMTYATKDYDSHNAYASGTLTIPVSGKYAINGKLASTDVSATHTLSVSIYQNGTQKSQNTTVGVAAATGADCLVSDIINCLAGDALTIRANDSGTTPSIVSSNVRNYISWTRVGN